MISLVVHLFFVNSCALAYPNKFRLSISIINYKSIKQSPKQSMETEIRPSKSATCNSIMHNSTSIEILNGVG